MYDHQTESLWLQAEREAVTGPMTGAKLKSYPSTITTWAKWKKRYPKTEVLSLDTGHARDYNRDPYESYYESQQGLFSFLRKKAGIKEKELIIGLEIDNRARAYPLNLLRKKKKIKDTLAGESIEIQLDQTTDQVTIKTGAEKKPDFIITYWMIWHNIHPTTDIYPPKNL